MKKYMGFIILAVALCFTSIGCGQNVDNLQLSVQAEVQKQIDSVRSQLPCALKVTKVTLIKKAGNEYSGMITLQGPAQSHDVAIDVVSDSSNFTYQWDMNSVLQMVWY
jgi:hypothetical protein